jgi:hypothetical protein
MKNYLPLMKECKRIFFKLAGKSIGNAYLTSS